MTGVVIRYRGTIYRVRIDGNSLWVPRDNDKKKKIWKRRRWFLGT